MKIRHKQSGVELEGSFCDCSNSGSGIQTRHYFASVDTSSLYDKREWEEVKPPPKWVDVTGEMEESSGVGDGSEYAVMKDGHWALKVQTQYGYRLRKVRLSDCSMHHGGRYEYKDYFIIEQRQP